VPRSSRPPPLGEIALCLSGGGFRAAGFHLGTLDTLDRLGLADDVRILSTASGGTLVGVAWALALAREQRFDDFFRDTYDALRLLQLPEKVGAALEAMRGPRSLVRAAAHVYDAHLYGGATLGDLLGEDGPLAGMDLSFNATELRYGLAFRFQRSVRPARIGNGRVWLDREAAARVRLGDVAAASSCFPGGFEPIVLPDDFEGLGPGAAVLHDGGGAPTARPLPLLDGGIYDNQAIEAAILAILRRQPRGPGRRKPDVLVFASDTTPPYAALDPAPRPRGRGRFTVGQLLGALFLAPLAGALAIALAAGVAAIRGRARWEDVLLLVPLAVLVAALAGFLVLRRRALGALALGAPGIDRRILSWTLGLGLAEAWAAFRDRARSLQAVAASVFPERVRRLVYRRVFEDPAFQGRRIANLVTDLSRDRAGDGLPPDLAPTPEMRAVAARAAAMPTTLWFTGADELRDLVAAGQVTACLNLLQHLARRGGLAPRGPDDARDVASAALDLWESLRRDPYAALADRLEPPRWRATPSAAGAVQRAFGA
jgi:predicted acylesterase/phospholipase RssA